MLADASAVVEGAFKGLPVRYDVDRGLVFDNAGFGRIDIPATLRNAFGGPVVNFHTTGPMEPQRQRVVGDPRFDYHILRVGEDFEASSGLREG